MSSIFACPRSLLMYVSLNEWRRKVEALVLKRS